MESVVVLTGSPGHTSRVFPSTVLSLLHLAHVSAAVLVGSGAVAGAVGGPVVDAVAGAALVVRRAVAGAILVAFASLVRCCAVGVRICAVLTLNVLLWQPLTLDVSLDPEVGEEDEKEGSVHPDEVDDHWELVVAAIHKVILGSMDRHQDELGLLERNQASADHLMT